MTAARPDDIIFRPNLSRHLPCLRQIPAVQQMLRAALVNIAPLVCAAMAVGPTSALAEPGKTGVATLPSTTVRGLSGKAIHLVAPLGTCFVAEDSRLAREIKSRLERFDLAMPGARVIAVYAPCNLAAPIDQPMTYGGYARIFMPGEMVRLLGEDYDTAAYLASSCAIYRKAENQAADEKLWQARRARLTRDAKRLVGRLPVPAVEPTYAKSAPSRLPASSPACFSWVLIAETSPKGPSLRGRIMAFGFSLEGDSTIHVDHAPFTDADSVDTHLSRMREMNAELRRLNGG
jgi:hypothetical protein